MSARRPVPAIRSFPRLAILLAMAGCVSTPPRPVWHPLPATALDRPLTLDESVRLALANDVVLADFAARDAAARAGLRAAAAIPNPMLALEWEGLGLVDAGMHLASLKSAITYPFLFAWPRRYKLCAAFAERDEQAWARAVDTRKLVAEVGAAWYGLVADRRKVKLAEELLTISRSSVEDVRKQRAAGLKSDYDVERAEADLLQTEGDAADATAQQRLDQLTFAFALGADRPVFARVSAPDDLGVAVPAPTETPPEDVVTAALAADPSWSKAHAAITSAEARLHVEQLGAFPFMDVGGAAGRKSEPGIGHGGTAGLDVPLPIFDRNQGGITRATAELSAAHVEAERTRRAVVAAISEDWERVRAASARWERFARPLTARLTGLDRKARSMYAAGEMTGGDLLQVRRDWKAAQRAEVDAWKDAAIARFTLESALGLHEGPSGSAARTPTATPGAR